MADRIEQAEQEFEDAHELLRDVERSWLSHPSLRPIDQELRNAIENYFLKLKALVALDLEGENHK